MKTFLKVIWGIFAVIGILSVILFINLRQKYGNFRLTVHPGYEARYDEFVDLLRTSGPFKKDTAAFEMKILQNPARAKEIRDYFQLEKLYDADADSWTKALAIGKYVAANIPHDNQEIEPEHRNAIDLWEYTKKYRTRVQLPVAQSPYLRTPACRWTGSSVYHLYAGR